MALKSMTGFSRADGADESAAWHWELRTVNGRGLEVRLRLPPGYEALEQPAREACKKVLARGNCTANLSLKQISGSATGLKLNEELFRQVAEAADTARGMSDAAAPSLDGLLAIRGVIEYLEDSPNEAEVKVRHQAILDDLEKALALVAEARGQEGEHLTNVISGQVDEIERLTSQIEQAPGRSADTLRARMKDQVARLIEASDSLDEDRLYQEAALLATKADIEEELERLKAHISAARDLLKQNDPVGRRFEFLTQEFNREANTICSKSNDVEISQAGLALKTVIDQLREQVQNIE